MLGPEARDDRVGLGGVVGVVAAGERRDVGLGDVLVVDDLRRRGRRRRRTRSRRPPSSDDQRAARVAAQVRRPAPAVRAVDRDPPVRVEAVPDRRPGGARRPGRASPGSAKRRGRRQEGADAVGEGSGAGMSRIVRHRPVGAGRRRILGGSSAAPRPRRTEERWSSTGCTWRSSPARASRTSSTGSP